MQVLPVVQRELLVAARQRMTYLSRSVSAGILLAVFIALLRLHSVQPTFAGWQMLMVLSVLVFFESMLAGIRYTSDCISEEKREGTLGLLFLTDLSGFDIVFGKIVGRGIRAFFSLVAAIPILALTVFLGGVTGRQITAVSITLLVCIVFSLSAGVFISSRGYRERNVLIGTLAFLLVMTFLPILLNTFAIRALGYYGLVDTLLRVSPYYAFSEAGRGFTANLPPSLFALCILSCVFVAYASWRIRRAFGEPEKLETKIGQNSRSVSRLKQFAWNPLDWLAGRGRIRSSRVLAFSAFALLFGCFGRMAFTEKWNWAIPAVFLGSYGMHALYKFLLTMESSRQLNEDKRSGALELLLTAPVSTNQIVRAQLLATWKRWAPAGVCLALMNYIWMTHRTFANDVVITTLLPCSIILLAADSILLPWRSLVAALNGERFPLTVFKTFIRTIVPPLVVIAFLLSLSMGASSDTGAALGLQIWTVGCVAVSAVLVVRDRRQLKDLRLLAAGEKLRTRWRLPRFPSLPSGKLPGVLPASRT